MTSLIVCTPDGNAPGSRIWNEFCSKRRIFFGIYLIKLRLEYRRGPVPLVRNLTGITKIGDF